MLRNTDIMLCYESRRDYVRSRSGSRGIFGAPGLDKLRVLCYARLTCKN